MSIGFFCRRPVVRESNRGYSLCRLVFFVDVLPVIGESNRGYSLCRYIFLY